MFAEHGQGSGLHPRTASSPASGTCAFISPWPTNLCREGNLSFVSQGLGEERRPDPPEMGVRGGTEVQEVGRCLLGPTIRHERFGASEKARR